VPHHFRAPDTKLVHPDSVLNTHLYQAMARSLELPGVVSMYPAIWTVFPHTCSGGCQGDLCPRTLVTLLIVEEGVGEVEDVFMTVDVGHSDGSVKMGY